MMRKRRYLWALALLTAVGVVNAQSDFETVKAFKDSVARIEEAVKNATGLAECDSILLRIEALDESFRENKELLDRSLYPENFVSSLDNLRSLLNIRREDFTKIVQLEDEIVNLNRRNTSLISEIKFLQKKAKKDAETIDALRNLTEELKKSIKERDALVRTVIDSLLSEFVKQPLTLNEAERTDMIEKVESGNLIFNVQRTIRDNIQFLKVTRLSPEDLSKLKKEKEDFYDLWSKIGPDIAKLYGDKREMVTEINIIDQLFDEWETEIDDKIWELIKYDFESYEITLKSFSDGDEFTAVIVNHIDDEIQNASIRKSDEVKRRREIFADSVWNAKTKVVWIPVLIDNGMLALDQKDSIEAKISEWREKSEEPGIPVYYYLLIALLLIVVLIYFIRKAKSPKSNEPDS